MKTKSLAVLLFTTLLANACVPSVAVTEVTVAPIVTKASISYTSTPEVTPEPEQQAASAWRSVRDPRYGFGHAIPCWWLIDPIPSNGISGVETIKNYDEAYFNAHSQKGFWDWPNGALKLDIVVIEGIDPAKADAEAYMASVDPTMTGLLSSDVQQFGTHSATVATLVNLDNPNDSNTTVFLFRLAPDKLLMVVPIPQSIIDTPDFQAILASVVLTPSEQITLPTITPAPALINSSCAQ